jgi:hypothetical protein
MSAYLPASAPADTGRRSKQVALVLLGTMGVVGGVVAWDAWQRAGRDPDVASTLPEAPAEPVTADRTYQNNEFVPGVGYYHAPYHSWYPFPFNHHDPARGYFAGGLWQAVPFAAGVLSSRPNAGAVTSALAAQQHYDQEQRARAGTSGFAGARRSTFGGSSFSTRPSTSPSSRPTATPSSRPAAPSARPASSPAPSTSKPTIQRGGFGSSGKGASGSGS